MRRLQNKSDFLRGPSDCCDPEVVAAEPPRPVGRRQPEIRSEPRFRYGVSR
jgi:hypothetical protein